MNDSTRMTDQQITEMLRERVRRPVPEDLPDVVIDQVRSVKHLPRTTRPGSRGRAGLLLVAAALVIAGSLIVTSAGGPRRTSGPSESAPAVVAPSTSAKASASASASHGAAQTGAPCPAVDGVARPGGAGSGRDPVPGPPSDPPVAGDVVILSTTNDSADPAVFDPLTSSPEPISISPWHLSSLYVDSWNPSADGSVLAPELFGTCDDVFVMRSDGTGLRTPFSALHRSTFGPAWAPDGSFLAVASAPGPVASPGVDPQPSTLLIWDPARDSITDLGRPCETCSPVGWSQGQGIAAWSPDSQRIAVDYADLSCGVSTSPPSSGTGCTGIAVVGTDGTWRRLSVGVPNVALLTWADTDRLLVVNGDGVMSLGVDSETLQQLPGSLAASATQGLFPMNRAISPDVTKVVSEGGVTTTVAITDLRSGTSTKIEPIPPAWLDLAWSPDSKWILVQASTDEYGANRGLYLVRVDGSQPVRRVLPGGFGVMAWMAAAS